MVRNILPSRLSSYKSRQGSANSQTASRGTSPRPGLGEHKDVGSLILQTTVVKARNLAAKDKSGTSDPYLVVNLGDAKEATPSIPKTLNPEWNVGFGLPILGLQSLLLECVCWDKDRVGKDYLGEFDLALEEIFANGQIIQEPRWYTLESKRKGRKKSKVSGEVQLQFSIIDPADPAAEAQQILQKFLNITSISFDRDDEDDSDLARLESGDIDDDDEEKDEDTSDETDDPNKPEIHEKRKKKLRMAKLKKKTKARAYEFTGGSEVVGIIFVEIAKITDLPPERNVTRTSFDMDPFVVVSLGRKTYRTRVKRHNLNPVYDEKMVFQVLRHEQQYQMSFTVVDRDKLSGNDFVGSVNFGLPTITSIAPAADPGTGLYSLREPPPDPMAMPSSTPNRSRFKLPMSRSSSSTSLNKLARPELKSANSTNSVSNGTKLDIPLPSPSLPETNDSRNVSINGSLIGSTLATSTGQNGGDYCNHPDDPDLKSYTLPLNLKNKERWEAKHSPQIFIKAKYLPYPALRQQFWRAMLKQYDADESARISKVELTTMLDSLGSTLKESTIDGFFKRFAPENNPHDTAIMDLTFDQAVICLEDQLQQTGQKKSWGDTIKGYMPNAHYTTVNNGDESGAETPAMEDESGTVLNHQSNKSAIPALSQDDLGKEGEEGHIFDKDDLADEREEEHVIEIRECPICHQPRLNKKSDADIITHIATCASQDWRQVNTIVMAGFVTSSQAQRKWYSKVITKIGYGGYKLGANSANILVQDRMTGQINEERMSVYVRLGIRLLYKGLKSRDMEKKRIRKLLRSLSVKQGRKYDDPASAREIEGFIKFHQLDMSEVLHPMEDFKNFNQFFYRELKPTARPCSAPNNPKIIVSPADCRSVVFNKMEEAQKIWVKGRDFSVEHLLGNAYPEDAKRYVNGALGIFRLAPQDYHRFHIPVDGIMDKPKLIEGEYYTVNPMAIRSSLDVYGENIRVVVPIDSVAHGRVMVICVGAMMVGSTIITRKAGERVGRAEELGYFKFGEQEAAVQEV
ncbi:MAG: hypothetical protein M1827_004409 [Pycnora praestabilis]|nr:MAG: hypothetical protein M1827_004409 [Pycnora praestabilis]